MTLWDKFLVKRRDGTVPEWPYLVLGARDPYAPGAIRYYAELADDAGEDPAYVADLRQLADYFESYREIHGRGDPAAAPHRSDDPETVAQIRRRYPG